ncbi:MAG: SDR family oxidoreductase [Microthrixaceae bacterium]
MQSLFGVEGKRALVTGGSRGIGRMISNALLANGAKVTIAARSGDQIEVAVDELSALGDCSGVVADVATDDGRAAMVDAVSGGLDILVNNAGMAIPDSPAGADADRSAAMLNTNVTAPLLLTQALLDSLRDSATAEDPSRVVMVGSVDGIRVPVMPLFSYGASKAALHSLTRHLAHSLAGEHVNVNAIAPGMFESAMTERTLSAPGMQERIEAGIPVGRIGAPQDMAAAALYLCGRSGAYLTGAVIPVDGGVSTNHQ